MHGNDAVEAVSHIWNELEATHGGCSPFQSLAVARVAAQAHVRARETPRIAVIRENGRPVVLLPTVVSVSAGLSTIRFLGDPLIQYGDAVAAADASIGHFESAWSAVADPRVASAVLLRKVRQDAKIAPVLRKYAEQLGETEAPFVDLRLPDKTAKKHSREVERLRRRLHEKGATQLEILRGEAAGPALLEAIALKRGWLSERGLPGRVLGNAVWERALTELVGKSCAGAELVAARLTVAGAVAAIEIGFADSRTWFAYIGAMSPPFAQLGPGHVQTADTIALCRNNGLACYDLLPPSQPYKRVLATDAIQVVDYGAPLNIAGWLPILAQKWLPHAKAIFNRLPAGLRGVVTSLLSQRQR